MSELDKWNRMESERRGASALIDSLAKRGLLLGESRHELICGALGIDPSVVTLEGAEADRMMREAKANVEDQVDMQGTRRSYVPYVVRIRFPQLIVDSRLDGITTHDVRDKLDAELAGDGAVPSDYLRTGRVFWHTEIKGKRVLISLVAGLANHIMCALDER